ncbi:MAG TPA: hypothetical protein VN698_14190 [Bacteroidia bacterium]|nr:hypothetical protein [Bacteroidia bacterium]
MSITNLNPNDIKTDCCDGGAFIGSAVSLGTRLFLKKGKVKFLENLGVASNTSFVEGEFVKVVAGVITKLDALPAAADITGLVAYDIDNLTATAATKRQPRATIYIEAEGLNQDALIFPVGTFSDTVKALLASKGFNTTKLYG